MILRRAFFGLRQSRTPAGARPVVRLVIVYVFSDPLQQTDGDFWVATPGVLAICLFRLIAGSLPWLSAAISWALYRCSRACRSSTRVLSPSNAPLLQALAGCSRLVRLACEYFRAESAMRASRPQRNDHDRCQQHCLHAQAAGDRADSRRLH